VATETGRLSAAEIFDRVAAGGRDELERPWHNLAFSGLGAGLAMGISGLGVSIAQAELSEGRVTEMVAYLLYPLGFLIVILGRQQLFTENTLFPVSLILAERRHLASTARLWAVVLTANLVGTLLFALLAVHTPALPAAVVDELQVLGVEAGARGVATVFWTGVVGGWLIALVAWLVTASDDTIGQLAVVILLTYVVGLGHFAHSIAGSAEVLAAWIGGDLPLTSYLSWLSGAVTGNAVGGVVIVAVFNYGQVHLTDDDKAQQS